MHMVRSRLERLRRGIRLRLVIPVLRSRRSPAQTARAVAVGSLWAFAPLAGLQVAFVPITWFVVARVLGLPFSLGVAMAWAVGLNAATILLPVYYLFYLTGARLLGAAPSGGPSGVWPALAEPANMDALSLALQHALVEFGWPMLIGALPWMALAGASGYAGGAWLAWRAGATGRLRGVSKLRTEGE